MPQITTPSEPGTKPIRRGFSLVARDKLYKSFWGGKELPFYSFSMSAEAREKLPREHKNSWRLYPQFGSTAGFDRPDSVLFMLFFEQEVRGPFFVTFNQDDEGRTTGAKVVLFDDRDIENFKNLNHPFKIEVE